MPFKSIVLCGIKHCGKSTQAKKIAAALKVPAYDTDDIIRERTGMDARAVYKMRGKEAFMKAEAEACDYLRGVLTADSRDTSANKDSSQDKNCAAVIATGGGICENETALQILKQMGTLVYLEIEEAQAADRIMREAKFFPDGRIENLPAYIAAKKPFDEKEARAIFREFYAERTKKYAAAADILIRMNGDSKEKNAQKILSALHLL